MARIVFLGTNGWYDSPTGNTICVLAEAEGFQVVLDAGNGIAKLGARADLARPTFVFLSHFHLDHVAGLHTLAMNRFPGGLTFLVEEGGTPWLETLTRLPYTAPLRTAFPSLRVLEVPAQAAELPFRASFLPLKHVPVSQGVRMEMDGKTVAFCLDTGYCENAVRLCAGADLAILECTLPAGTETEHHLTPERCARIAREAGVKRLALTHFEALRYPTFAARAAAFETARALFPETVLSADGTELEV
jgi:ribonuclease BN (tRNA processing enzyme)